MSKEQMIARYTQLTKRRTELVLQSGIAWGPEQEKEERAILQEMASLETAIRLPLEEMQSIPRMVTIRVASEETGLSYSCIRKLCLQKKIVFLKIGTKYLINMGKLAEYLNGCDEVCAAE